MLKCKLTVLSNFREILKLVFNVKREKWAAVTFKYKLTNESKTTAHYYSQLLGHLEKKQKAKLIESIKKRTKKLLIWKKVDSGKPATDVQISLLFVCCASKIWTRLQFKLHIGDWPGLKEQKAQKWKKIYKKNLKFEIKTLR